MLNVQEGKHLNAELKKKPRAIEVRINEIPLGFMSFSSPPSAASPSIYLQKHMFFFGGGGIGLVSFFHPYYSVVVLYFGWIGQLR
jgi:hypothetical protein